MKNVLLTALLTLMGCCALAQNFNFTCNIHTSEYDGLSIYLIKKDVVDREKNVKVDSCIIKNGKYNFSITVPDSAYWALVALPPKDKNFAYGLPELNIIVENGKVVADCRNYTQTLKGGVLNQQYDDIVLIHERDLRKQVDEMIIQRQEAEKKHPYTDVENDAYSKRLAELYQANRKYMYQFIAKNIDNAIGAHLFLTYGKDYFSEEFYNEMSQKVNPFYLHQAEALRQARIDAQKYAEQERIATAAGNPYKDFVSKDIDGKDIHFSDLIKKSTVTLLDFWASWCIPCIQESKELKTLYNEYHEKGFNIVSVSLDTNRQRWIDAIKKYDLPWTHLSTLKGFKEDAAIEYAVHAIPYVVLIDHKGNIISQNQHGKVLHDAIKKQFK